jgi:hypothetical protein
VLYGPAGVYGFRAYAVVEMEHCSHVTLSLLP